MLWYGATNLLNNSSSAVLETLHSCFTGVVVQNQRHYRCSSYSDQSSTLCHLTCYLRNRCRKRLAICSKCVGVCGDSAGGCIFYCCCCCCGCCGVRTRCWECCCYVRHGHVRVGAALCYALINLFAANKRPSSLRYATAHSLESTDRTVLYPGPSRSASIIYKIGIGNQRHCNNG